VHGCADSSRIQEFNPLVFVDGMEILKSNNFFYETGVSLGSSHVVT
jgi:hypothetical protein